MPHGRAVSQLGVRETAEHGPSGAMSPLPPPLLLPGIRTAASRSSDTSGDRRSRSASVVAHGSAFAVSALARCALRDDGDRDCRARGTRPESAAALPTGTAGRRTLCFRDDSGDRVGVAELEHAGSVGGAGAAASPVPAGASPTHDGAGIRRTRDGCRRSAGGGRGGGTAATGCCDGTRPSRGSTGTDGKTIRSYAVDAGRPSRTYRMGASLASLQAAPVSVGPASSPTQRPSRTCSGTNSDR